MMSPPAQLCCFAASITLLQLLKTMSNTSSSHESTPASVPTEPAVAPVVPTAGKTRAEQPAADSSRLDPTRYGDWEKNGRCIDF
jgi:hypothetical protein